MSAAVQNTGRAWGALAVLIAFIALAAAGGFVGYTLVQAKQIELDARQNELAVLTRPRPPARAAAKENEITVNPFLSEENFALSANALQKRVVGLIESTGGKLITVGIDPPVTGDEDLARRVSVQVSAELTNDALQKVLYQLESQPPYVFVETLGANVSEAKDASGKPDVQAAPRLQVTMSVIGYRRKGQK
jgi:hypothetical protein